MLGCVALNPDQTNRGLARRLSAYEWTAIHDLQTAYESSFVDSEDDNCPQRGDSLTLSSLINTSGFIVRKMIIFAKKLADFSLLSQVASLI
ncbi:unnamed protein product [Protopolystoma xenopodis]|uniref:Uncharacterized protein n=1 Tax=Protopolystoma xenopodis TaxID=117903 RepID=A0A448WPF3_9PLAT|nr:unnamed protein product [Protopolystoma xenopodis]